MRYATECCLDTDNNSICDKDESNSDLNRNKNSEEKLNVETIDSNKNKLEEETKKEINTIKEEEENSHLDTIFSFSNSKYNNLICINEKGKLGCFDIFNRKIQYPFNEDYLAKKYLLEHEEICVITLNDEVYCGQINTTGTLSVNNFNKISNLNNVTDLDIAITHKCALLIDGTVKCWGSNIFGQSGCEKSTCGENIIEPRKIDILNDVKQIDLGQVHSCALINDGTVKCWGDNGYSQLGSTTYESNSFPTLVKDLSNVEKISTNYFTTCALLIDGTVKCWGSNIFDNAEDNLKNSESNSLPKEIPSLNNIKNIFIEKDNICVLINDGTVKCWGKNERGQIGGDYGFQNVINNPTTINGFENITELFLENSITCGIDKTNTILCLGGQLGVIPIPYNLTSGPNLEITLKEKKGNNFIVEIKNQDSTEVKVWKSSFLDAGPIKLCDNTLPIIIAPNSQVNINLINCQNLPNYMKIDFHMSTNYGEVSKILDLNSIINTGSGVKVVN